ncbi:thiol reductant ABC exporter subunit CydC [Catelliglobosispora koreensis]|uniref:thiol reductant ABC exporter subunit CydC n=1 Tax=Catelliglobosispora koreensis TaxID=129052 RepID=UPI00035FEE12|nr:thiol reductant ABC exporter subunit CydC [Catelliglobosispora koreensis]
MTRSGTAGAVVARSEAVSPSVTVSAAGGGLLRPFWWRLVGAGLLGALTEAAGIALLATATWLIMTAAGQPPLPALTVAIVMVRALAIGRGTLRYTERLASHDAVLRIVTEVRAKLFAALTTRPLARNADALSRMVSDVDAVQDAVVRVALPFFACGLIALLTAAGGFLFGPLTGLALAAGLLVTAVLVPYLGYRLARSASAQLAPLRAAYAVTTVDVVHGAADLAAYGAAARYEAVGAAQAAELSAVERRLARRSFALDTLSTIVSGLTAAAVLLAAREQGTSLVWAAALTIAALGTGELTLALLAAARKLAEIQEPLRRLGALGISLRPALLCTHRDSFMQPAVPLSVQSKGVEQTVPEVRLDNVSVDGRLYGISLALPPGHKVAVIGPSGAGKSTLLQVIAGAIKPDHGTVTPTVAEFTVATGLMADAHVFHATIEDNLRIAKPDATDSELRSALDTAGLTEYQIDVLAGEDGAALSGGQRQRLALARAILAAPPVLLLDEPTEGLDPRHAVAVLRSVLESARDRTVVVVTHHLQSLDRLEFDEIIEMDAGRLLSLSRNH